MHLTEYNTKLYYTDLISKTANSGVDFIDLDSDPHMVFSPLCCFCIAQNVFPEPCVSCHTLIFLLLFLLSTAPLLPIQPIGVVPNILPQTYRKSFQEPK